MIVERVDKEESLQITASAAIFLEDLRGCLLLLQRPDKKWGPPAGRFKSFESSVLTMFRELRGETGIETYEVDNLGLLGVYTVAKGQGSTGIGFVFRGQLRQCRPIVPKDRNEIVSSRFYSREEVKRLIRGDSLSKPEYNQPALSDWLAGNNFSLEPLRGIY